MPANAESTGLQKQGHHSWSHRLFLTPTPTYLLFHVFVFYVLFLVFLFFAVDPLFGPFFVLLQARKCHCCQSAVKRKASIAGESPPMSIPSKNWRLSILNFACTRASAHGLHTTGPVSHMQSSGKHLALTRRPQMLQRLPSRDRCA